MSIITVNHKGAIPYDITLCSTGRPYFRSGVMCACLYVHTCILYLKDTNHQLIPPNIHTEHVILCYHRTLGFSHTSTSAGLYLELMQVVCSTSIHGV